MTPQMEFRAHAAGLSPESEFELAKRVVAGDAQARCEFIVSEVHLVRLHALRLGCRGEAFEDAMQDGMIGLINAIDRFDPGRGTRFSSFAWSWISGAILRGRLDLESSGTDPSELELTSGIARGSNEIGVEPSRLLCLRFGLHGGEREPLSRQATADILGVTVGQLRAMENRELEALRESFLSPGQETAYIKPT